jgi:hypothetical protein
MFIWWTNRFWVASLDLILFLDLLKLFCEHAPRKKLSGSTNFIIFGTYESNVMGV